MGNSKTRRRKGRKTEPSTWGITAAVMAVVGLLWFFLPHRAIVLLSGALCALSALAIIVAIKGKENPRIASWGLSFGLVGGLVSFMGFTFTVSAYSFQNCDKLTTLELPATVTLIDSYAFYDCDGLKTVTMGNNVTTMGNSVFEHCDILEDVTLSLNLGKIPEYAFKECAQLTQIVIPYYCVSIGDYAFNRSPRLVKVVTYAGLGSIGEEAFSYPNLTVFYGVAGSYTQDWCEANGFQFVANSVPASAVTLPLEELYLAKHETFTLVPYIEPEDFADAIVYKSSNNAVVTVDAEGNLIAQDTCGTATVKVTVGKVSDSIKVHVIDEVSRITLNETKLNLQITGQQAESFQLVMQTVPEGVPLEGVTWTTSDSNVATVTDGLVQAVAPGKATITVEILTKNGSTHTADCEVEVVLGGVIQKLVLNKTALTLADTETFQLSASIEPEDCANNPILWSSSDETVATVDSNGVVYAVAAGNTQIYVETPSGGLQICAVTVNDSGSTIDSSGFL